MDHLYNIILASAFLFIFVSLGDYTLTRCGFSFKQPLEAFLFSTAIGGGLLSSGILLIGLLNGFHKLIFFLLFLICLFIVRKHLRNTILLFRKSVCCLRENSNFFPLLVFASAAVFMICRALAPPTDWDSLMLHLRVPAQFLQKGGIYLPEDNLAAAFVQLVHMWYAPLLAFGGVAGPALLNAFFALALCLAAFAFCLQFLNSPVANLTLAAFWGNAVILLVAITPRVDVTIAFFLFLGHYALLKAMHHHFETRFYYLCAILFGFSIGVKYNAIIYILATSPLIVWAAISSSKSCSASIRKIFIFVLLIIISSSPWLMKNITQFQSPLYPFFTERQIEPWLEHFYSKLSPQLSSIKKVIADNIQQMANPFNLLEYIKAPGQLMVEPEGHFYIINIIFFVLPLWLLFLRKRMLNCLMVPAILYILMLITFWPFSNIRYLIPAMIPLTIGGSHIISEICNKLFKNQERKKFYLYVFIIIALMPPTIAMYYWPGNRLALKYLIGLSSEKDFLLAKSMPYYSYGELVYFVNNNFSEKDKLLMVFEARGYYFRVPVIQDNELSNWALLSQKRVTPYELRSAGISYVLVNKRAPVYLRRRGMDLNAIRWDEFTVFEENYLEAIFKNELYVLYSFKN